MKTITNPKYRQNQKIKFKKKRYDPLYGLEILHLLAIKDGYTLVSLSPNSIPNAGSLTLNITNITPIYGEEVEKVIIHKNLNITIKTKNKGFVKYSK